MKALYIDNTKCKEIELFDNLMDEEFDKLLNEFSIMESPVIYFSAGDSKIKEILIQKDPTFSV